MTKLLGNVVFVLVVSAFSTHAAAVIAGMYVCSYVTDFAAAQLAPESPAAKP